MTKHLRLNITRQCSMRCSYCVSHKYDPKARRESYLEQVGPEVYLGKINKLLAACDHGPLVIDLKGEGDVLQSPYIKEVVYWALYHKYNIEFQTNLHGFNRLRDVLKIFKPAGRIKLSISFHYGAYLEFLGQGVNKLLEFWGNFHVAEEMIRQGYVVPGKVDIPLSPNIMGDPKFASYLIPFQRRGFTLNPAILVGHFHDLPYPVSYTPAERQWVESILDQYQVKHPPQQWTAAQIPYVEHALYLKGEPCTVRMQTVDVMADGRIRYCQCKPPFYAPKGLADLNTPEDYAAVDLFLSEPIPCPGELCGCMSRGQVYCLRPQGKTLAQYFVQYYRDQGRPEVAALFQEDPPHG